MRVALVRGREPREAGEADGPLVAALRERGVEVGQPCWDDEDLDWGAFDLVTVRTTGDHAARREQFLDWVDDTARSTRVLNPPEVLRWNSHRGYLLELEERGAPVVPTAWLGQGDRVALADLLDARGWHRAVLKPAVGLGGQGLVRVTREDAASVQGDLDRLLAQGDVLVQPHLDAIETLGELSVVLIAGEVTHGVRTPPADDDHRAHRHRGGRTAREDVDPDVAALARWVGESTGHELAFARVDLIPDAVGTWQVVELEAVDPDLHLSRAPAAADRLAAVLCARTASP